MPPAGHMAVNPFHKYSRLHLRMMQEGLLLSVLSDDVLSNVTQGGKV